MSVWLAAVLLLLLLLSEKRKERRKNKEKIIILILTSQLATKMMDGVTSAVYVKASVIDEWKPYFAT